MGQTDGQIDGRIAVSFNAPYGIATRQVSKSDPVLLLLLLLLLLLFITPKQHDIQTIDITILHIENTNRANIKHKT